MGFSSADLKAMLGNVSAGKNKSAAKSKYNNVKIEVDGEKFDSKKEAARYGQLLLLQKSGQITNLQKQVPFRLEVNGQLVCKYIADFTYAVNGVGVVEDCKSKHTRTLPVYRIKKKLLKALYNIDIKES